MRETEDETDKWRDILWIKILMDFHGLKNILKITKLQGNLQVECNPYKNTTGFS